MQARDLNEEAGEESPERRNKQLRGESLRGERLRGESLNKFKSELESREKVKSPLTGRPIYVGTSPCLDLPTSRSYVGHVCRR